MKQHLSKYWGYYAAGTGAVLIGLLAVYLVKAKQAKLKAEADAAAAAAARVQLTREQREELEQTTDNVVSQNADTKGRNNEILE